VLRQFVRTKGFEVPFSTTISAFLRVAMRHRVRRTGPPIKALVRARRGRRRIESGLAKSITELAEQEGVTDAYVCRLLPLTCLAPDILEAILDGRQPKGLRLAEMLGNGPLEWEQQRGAWRAPLRVQCE
jgi:ParB-like chromosome segregation protein Spo0J